MTVIASRGQLRASFLRWALLIVPTISLLGFLAGRLSQSGPGNPWFDALVKPSLFPPPATFGIVWSILYVMMGLALTMLVTARGAFGRGAALAAFAVQFALNLCWSPLFFGAHQITGALYLMAALDIAVLVTVALAWRVRRPAALLLLPYLAWVLFATVLNWQFLVANPDADGRAAGPATTRIQL
ncbi:TspO/MBR family protein [Novosphingobium sp. Gsoil 351]|uniref:TspO/MBR family protein n=1 Tax=Novosphingobium sp. Gsoil 351 TaxID=2675225 RepID=UPI0012B454C9|nr:TspO/MBR family protein [Novosphingobium sp. Gsoil 351]QGN55926.1 tryptophan-rich sensory protein [Novosphingobium sp. Gsoil 351]